MLYFNKIYRRFFTKTVNPIEVFQSLLVSNKCIQRFEENDLGYFLELKDNINIVIRNQSFSDFDVFKQVFEYGEYDIVLSALQQNIDAQSKVIIIDAGANIGLTSVYLASYLSNVQIFAVEPSPENLKIFDRNKKLLISSDRIEIYQKGLSEQQNIKFKIANDFRDNRDWATTTVEDGDGEIGSVTLKEIIDLNKLTYISLLKIDIEGAERNIFKTGNDLSFLEITKMIAIEIHDEFDCREEIYKILKSFGFYLFEAGETTICINTNHFCKDQN